MSTSAGMMVVARMPLSRSTLWTWPMRLRTPALAAPYGAPPISPGLQRGERANGDDGAAAPLDHAGQHRLGQRVDAGEVDGDHAVPLLLADPADVARLARVAGVVDEHVDAAERARPSTARARAPPRACRVARPRRRAAARRARSPRPPPRAAPCGGPRPRPARPRPPASAPPRGRCRCRRPSRSRPVPRARSSMPPSHGRRDRSGLRSVAPSDRRRPAGRPQRRPSRPAALIQAQTGCSKWSTRVGRPWTTTSRIW